MHLSVILSFALTTIVKSAIVAAPTGENKPLAIELPDMPGFDTMARDFSSPLECEEYCGDKMHCCLISGLYQRSVTMTSSSTGEDARVTETLTRPATTVTRTLLEAGADVPFMGQLHGPVGEMQSEEQGFAGVVVMTTVEIVSVTATTVVPITLSTIPTPSLTGSEINANATSTPSDGAVNSTTDIPPTTNILASSPPTSSTEETPPPPKATLTSTTVADPTSSTSSASLNGEPSAIQSTLGSGAGGADGMLNGAGGAGKGGLLVAWGVFAGVLEGIVL